MSRTWKSLAFLFALLLAAGIVAGCSDDDDPGAPADTAAPMITDLSPHPDETEVALGEPIRIMFDGEMDAESVERNISVTQTTITAMSWSSGTDTLTIEHGSWARGLRIDVLIDGQIADAAGNVMDNDIPYRFYTTTPGVDLLDVVLPEPVGGGIVLNPAITMIFNAEMNTYSLQTNTQVTDTTAKTVYPATFESGMGSQMIMRFDDVLPAETTFEVNISQDATSDDGRQLASAKRFQFTTGTVEDIDPPHLVSIWPESGSTIAASTPYMKFVFDEAVDLESFWFSSANVAMVMQVNSGMPYLSPDGTELFIAFGGGGLAPGSAMEMVIDEYADIFGNIQYQDIVFEATVEGEPDHYPAEDGQILSYYETWTKGTTGSQFVESYGDNRNYIKYSAQGGGIYNLEEYHELPMTTSRSWDIVQKTASDVRLLGFHDYDEVVGKADPEYVEYDVIFDDPLTWLKLPMRTCSWTDATTTTDNDQNTFTIDIEGEILGETDRMPLVPIMMKDSEYRSPLLRSGTRTGGPEFYWKDLWATVINHTISQDGETFVTGVDSIWYSPAFGPVIIRSYEEDGGRWSRSEAICFPFAGEN